MKFRKRQKNRKSLCPLLLKKVAGQHPSHIFFFTSCYNSSPTYRVACHEQIKPGHTSENNKKRKDLHTLQQTSLKLPKFALIIDLAFARD